MTKEELLDQLIRRTRHNKVTPFIGSGFSFNAGAPRGKELIRIMIEEANLNYDPNLPEPSLRKVAQDFEEKEGRHELIELLSRLFNYERKDSSDHKLLQKIPQFNTYFTTNYDTEIEDAYPKASVTVVNSNQGCTYANSTPIRVYKIHGDLSSKNDPDSIVITENDYNRFYERVEPTLLCSAFVNACVETHIVFIGYSAEDENILKLVDMVDKLSKHNRRDMYLVAPGLRTDQIKNLDRRRIHYIDAYADEYLNKLVESLYLEICQDYNDKKISAEILSSFCHKNNLEPIFKEGTKQNQVIDLVPIGDNKRHVKIRMKIKPDHNNNRIVDAQPTDFAGFKIPTYEIIGNIHQTRFINNICIGKPIRVAHLYIHPVCKVRTEMIKIPGTRYREFVNCCCYNDKDTEIIEINTPLYYLRIVENSDENGDKKYNIYTTFKETYESSAQAIHWMEILIEIYKNKVFFIGNHGYESTFEYRKDQFGHDRHMLYYLMVAKIETEFNVDFLAHNKYTEERLWKSYLLYSFLSKKEIEFPMSYHRSIGWEGMPLESIKKSVSKGKNYWMESIRKIKVLTFNEIKFPVEYERIYIPKGKITEIMNTVSGTEVVTFKSALKHIIIESPNSLDDDYLEGVSLGC